MSEIDHEMTEFPVCPKCGTTDQDWWDGLCRGDLENDGDTMVFDCANCNAEYTVEISISHSFTTT